MARLAWPRPLDVYTGKPQVGVSFQIENRHFQFAALVQQRPGELAYTQAQILVTMRTFAVRQHGGDLVGRQAGMVFVEERFLALLETSDVRSMGSSTFWWICVRLFPPAIASRRALSVRWLRCSCSAIISSPASKNSPFLKWPLPWGTLLCRFPKRWTSLLR